MLELFLVGSPLFFALLSIETIVLFICVANEKGVAATVSLALTLVALFFGSDIPFIQLIKENPLRLVALVVCYFLIGTGVAVFKWWRFCLKRFEEFKETRTSWLKEKHPGLELNPAFAKEFDNYIWSTNRYSEIRKPEIYTHKHDFIRWASFWVFVVIWGLINDFITAIFLGIYNRLKNTLQAIADRIYQE